MPPHAAGLHLIKGSYTSPELGCTRTCHCERRTGHRRRLCRPPPPPPALTPPPPLPLTCRLLSLFRSSAIVFNRLGGIKDEVYEEGTHFMLPWFERPIIYDVRPWCQSGSGAEAEQRPA